MDHTDTDIDTDLETLKCIVALLFSLAGWADRAANSRYLVRGFLIWILSYAETVAYDYLIGGVPPTISVLQRNSSAEAVLLAQRLRALAREGQELIHAAYSYKRWVKSRETAPAFPVPAFNLPEPDCRITSLLPAAFTEPGDWTTCGWTLRRLSPHLDAVRLAPAFHDTS